MRNLVLSFILFLANSQIMAQQDSIILLNGKVYRGEILKIEGGVLTYEETKNDQQKEEVQITTDRIFSCVDDGVETVFYVENEFVGDFLPVESARFATLGSYDARQTFKPRFVFISSLIIGLGVSLLDTYYSQNAYDKFVALNGAPPINAQVGFFGAKPTLAPIFAPMILSASWALPSFRIKPHQLLQKNLYGNEDYYRGFHRVARQKRVLAALKGSAIGIGAGMLSFVIFRP